MKMSGISPQANRLSQFISLLALVGMLVLPGCGGGGSGSGPSITIDSPSVAEGDTGTAEIVFTVTLSEDAANTLTVDYTTADDVATAPDDYTTASGQLTIPAGSRTANVSVFVIGDSVLEQDETFGLEISNPQGINLSENTFSSVGTISNDDDADPKGYFTGSATVDGSIILSDLVGIGYNNRLFIFSKTGASNVLYDIAISSVVVNDYIATADVYIDGAISQSDVPITNGVTNELQISGNFTGTGLADGSFSLDYDLGNNAAASQDRIEAVVGSEWTGLIYGQDNDGSFFRVDVAGQYTSIDDNLPKCLIQDDLPTLMLDINIYQLSHEVQEGSGCTYIGTGYTGFASVVTTTTTDDTLYFAFANGTASLFSVMNEP